MKKTLVILIIAIFTFGLLAADVLTQTAQSTVDFTVENTRDEDPPVGFTVELQDYNAASLTWMEPGSAPIIWDQIDNEGEGQGKSAQDFEAAYNAYDAEVAGDFVLDAQAELTGAVFLFFYSIADHVAPGQFNVSIYPDMGGYPSEDAIHTTGTSIEDAGETTVDYWVDFNDPVTLDAGTYWIGFNMILDYTPLEVQCYAYQKVSLINGTEAYWRNPGQGFPDATGNWEATVVSEAGQPEDITFGLLGNYTGATSRDLLGYNIYQNGALVNTDAPIAQTAALIEGLTEGTHEFYVIAAYDEGDSEPTPTLSLDVVLNAPANLNSTVSGSNVVSNWSAPATTRSISYKIYRNDVLVGEPQSTYYIDVNPPAGDYTYYVTAVYTGGVESGASNETEVSIGTDSDDTTIPAATAFNSIYPNPFNPTTNLYYSVSNDSNVQLAVYNLKGQMVKTIVNGHQAAGNYQVSWDGTDNNGNTVPSGIYFSKFQSGDYTSTKKMILMK